MSQAATTQEITLAIGDPIPWARAPGGIAQVEDLGRSNVVIYYRAATGRVCRPRVSAIRLAEMIARDQAAGPGHHSPILPIHNPLGRGARWRSKTYHTQCH